MVKIIKPLFFINVRGRNTTRAKLESAMRGHVLAKEELVGVYDRLDK